MSYVMKEMGHKIFVSRISSILVLLIKEIESNNLAVLLATYVTQHSGKFDGKSSSKYRQGRQIL